MDPSNPRDLSRLREAMRQADKDMSPFRAQYRTRLEMYAGSGYGNNNEEVDTPFNVYNLALRVYKRRLFSGTPKALITSRTHESRTAAYELSLAMDQLLREIDFMRTMQDVIQQALLSVGIVKVMLEPQEAGDDVMGFLHDAGQPYCDAVLLEDFAFDTSAKRWDQIDWCGNRYRMPLEDIRNNPMFNQDGTDSLSANDKPGEDMRESGDESVKHLGSGDSVLTEEAREYTTLWDVWLPRERLFVTLPDNSGVPLRVSEWNGPEGGPYHLLSFDPIPGNILPVAPASHLESMAKLINRIIRKLGDQADRQKTIPLITRAASADGVGKAIEDCVDGQAVTCDDPRQINELRLGGIDQQSFAFFMASRDMFSWLAGNIDTMGGLSSGADTLGQEKLLADSNSALVQDLEMHVIHFAKTVMTDLAWYLYTDPFSSRKLVKKIPGTSLEIERQWGPERRDLPFYLFNFEVDPYSIHTRSPSERLQVVMQLIQQMGMLPQIAQSMQAVGLELEVEELWRLLVRYTGLTELGDLIKASGQPISSEPGYQATPGDMTKPPQTSREYIRRNVGSGAQQQAMGQQALAMMMAKQGAEQGANAG